MLKNYLVIALRHLWRSKLSSCICMTAFALGIASTLYLFLFIQNEISMDNFHHNKDFIYRVLRKSVHLHNEIEYGPFTGTLARDLLLDNFPVVTHAVRFLEFPGIVGHHDRYFLEQSGFSFSDPEVFQMFTFPLLKGNPDTVLSQPHTVVLTEKMARKYFNDSDPMGQVLTFTDTYRGKQVFLTVTGILKPIPQNTHLQFDFLASFDALGQISESDEGQLRFLEMVRTYIQLTNPSAAETLQKMLANKAYHLPAVNGLQEKEATLDIEPLKDVNFSLKVPINSYLTFGTIALFSFLGMLILIVTCVNTVGLLTARFTTRAKEIGLRKVVGAKRRTLILQFLSESIIMSFFSLALALVLVELFLPVFNSLRSHSFPFGMLTPKHVSIDYLHNWGYYGMMLLSTIFVGGISGIYPAFVLSAFRPVTVLKGRKINASTKLRDLLLVIQFSSAMLLFIWTGTFLRGFSLPNNHELGFNKENIILLDINSPLIRQHFNTFKAELLRNPQISHVTASSTAAVLDLGVMLCDITSPNLEGKKEVPVIYVDADYLPTYQILLVEGNFLPQQAPDTQKFLINQKAKELFGWNSATGKHLTFPELETGGIVTGVTKNFRFKSSTGPIEPLILVVNSGKMRVISIRLLPGHNPETITEIQDVWEKIFPTVPFEYAWWDQKFENSFTVRLFKQAIFMSKLFTTLAVLIASLGLIGIIHYEISLKTKEIGIRKMLGASSFQIIIHFIKRYSRYVLIANLIAWPVAFYAFPIVFEKMEFSELGQLGIGIFIQSGCFFFLLTAVIVSAYTWKTAQTNPVEALRYE